MNMAWRAQVCRILSRLRLWDLGNILDEETFNSLLRLTAMFTITSVKAWQVRDMSKTQLHGCRLSSVSLLQRVPRSNGLDLD
jgi:hypothetical protein